jgi:2-isopropylmalate synthase
VFKYPHLDLGTAGANLSQLTPISRTFDDAINRVPNPHAAYVGSAAFAHKGGLHISAIQKNAALYEHIDPDQVGNERDLVISQQAGRAAILARCQSLGIDVDPEKMDFFLQEFKRLESKGYSFDGADASFDLLARRRLSNIPTFYTLRSFRVIDERCWNAKDAVITLSEATVKMDVGDTHHMAVAEGNGPVNALDRALRTVLSPFYPEVNEIRLIDYKVRILTPTAGTEAVTRVTITSRDHHDHVWTTVGVSANVIDASCHALQDSLLYFLMRERDGCS